MRRDAMAKFLGGTELSRPRYDSAANKTKLPLVNFFLTSPTLQMSERAVSYLRKRVRLGGVDSMGKGLLVLCI